MSNKHILKIVSNESSDYMLTAEFTPSGHLKFIFSRPNFDYSFGSTSRLKYETYLSPPDDAIIDYLTEFQRMFATISKSAFDTLSLGFFNATHLHDDVCYTRFLTRVFALAWEQAYDDYKFTYINGRKKKKK